MQKATEKTVAFLIESKNYCPRLFFITAESLMQNWLFLREKNILGFAGSDTSL